MKLLVVSQYIWPETFIGNDLVVNGHEVVATAKPNYPDSDVFAGCRAGGIQRERYLDKIDMVRVPGLAVWCAANIAGMVHISTDCVFSGRKGQYTEVDLSDTEDCTANPNTSTNFAT